MVAACAAEAVDLPILRPMPDVMSLWWLNTDGEDGEALPDGTIMGPAWSRWCCGGAGVCGEYGAFGEYCACCCCWRSGGQSSGDCGSTCAVPVVASLALTQKGYDVLMVPSMDPADAGSTPVHRRCWSFGEVWPWRNVIAAESPPWGAIHVSLKQEYVCSPSWRWYWRVRRRCANTAPSDTEEPVASPRPGAVGLAWPQSLCVWPLPVDVDAADGHSDSTTGGAANAELHT